MAPKVAKNTATEDDKVQALLKELEQLKKQVAALKATNDALEERNKALTATAKPVHDTLQGRFQDVVDGIIKGHGSSSPTRATCIQISVAVPRGTTVPYILFDARMYGKAWASKNPEDTDSVQGHYIPHTFVASDGKTTVEGQGICIARIPDKLAAKITAEQYGALVKEAIQELLDTGCIIKE